MEMEQLMELIEIAPEIAWLIFGGVVLLLLVFLLKDCFCSCVKDWWKMIKKE